MATTLAQTEGASEDLTAESTKNQLASVVNAVNGTTPKLERSNSIIGPCGDHGDAQQAENTRNQTQRDEDSWNGKQTETDLSFHHQSNRAQPADLNKLNLERLFVHI
jgi:hypothetical protein